MAASAQTAPELPSVTVQATRLPSDPPFGTSLGGEALNARQNAIGDTASLLNGVPGVDLQVNGGISSLPSIHGLADDRVSTLVDGVQTTAACPNHMNPPLSYADPSAVGRVDVFGGIAPVSKGGDNIGGTVAVESKPPLFTDPGQGIRASGQLSAYYKSNAGNLGSSVQAAMAGETVSLGATGGWNHAADYTSGNGNTVYSTSYETMDYSVIAAVQKDGQTLVFRGGQQFIPYENFANQPMDMVGNHQQFVNAHYTGAFDWGMVDALGFWNHVNHQMNTTATDKQTGMNMPMYTDGVDSGYNIKAELPLTPRDTVRFGNELHLQTLNDWWPPTTAAGGGMGPNTFLNINNGRRDRFGTFAEWEGKWNPAWTTVAGVRNDIVWSDAGNVRGYDTTATYAPDAAAFNARRHSRTDYNFDGTLLSRYEPDQVSTYEAGFARKTRSPSLYERYAWTTNGGMTAPMIGWFGDGNGYVGNPGLRPESAHTVSVSAGWHDDAHTDWEVKATPYFTYVHDYINVDYLGPNTYNNAGTTNGSILRFANHDAELYGTDLSGRKTLADDDRWGRFGVGGVAGWVRGYQVNNGNSLYHLMPLNAELVLDHKLGGWSSAAELRLVDGKSEADPLRQEPTTPGYAVINLRTAYDWQNIRLDLGIDNLFNRQHYDPLGGVALGDYWHNGGTGFYAPLAAMGRSFNAGVTMTF